MSSNLILKDLGFHQKPVTSCRWSHDGKYLGSSSKDKTCKISQLEPSGNIRSFHTASRSSSSEAYPRELYWNPTTSSSFCICADGYLEIWDVRAPRPGFKTAICKEFEYAAWSPDAKYIAYVDSGNRLDILDLAAGKTVAGTRSASELNELTWTAGSNYLLIATNGAELRTGDIEILSFGDNKIGSVDKITAHTERCHRVRIDRQYNRMAVGSADQTITLWELEDLICYKTINLDLAGINFDFSGDGKHLAVTSNSPPDTIDKKSYMFEVYDVCNGALLARQDMRHKVNNPAWHPTEKNLVVASVEDTSPSPAYMRMITLPKTLFDV
jgi:THO complex subunit 3